MIIGGEDSVKFFFEINFYSEESFGYAGIDVLISCFYGLVINEYCQ